MRHVERAVHDDVGDGIEAARQITKSLPKTRILALSMQKDSVYVREMLRAGAKGYLLKDCDEKDLLDAVRAVAAETGARLIDVAARLRLDELRGREIDYLEGDIFNHQGPGGHTRTAEIVREVLGG